MHGWGCCETLSFSLCCRVQEAEGGVLLIGAYMRILQPPSGQQGDVSEAESRLLTFCRRFVADAAEDAWAGHQAALATGASDIHTWDEVRTFKT